MVRNEQVIYLDENGVPHPLADQLSRRDHFVLAAMQRLEWESARTYNDEPRNPDKLMEWDAVTAQRAVQIADAVMKELDRDGN